MLTFNEYQIQAGRINSGARATMARSIQPFIRQGGILMADGLRNSTLGDEHGFTVIRKIIPAIIIASQSTVLPLSVVSYATLRDTATSSEITKVRGSWDRPTKFNTDDVITKAIDTSAYHLHNALKDGQAPASALNRIVEAGIGQGILNIGRSIIEKTAGSDSLVNKGSIERMVRSSGGCNYCAAGRIITTSSNETVDLGYHEDCRCTLSPIFSETVSITEFDRSNVVKEARNTIKNVGGNDIKDLANLIGRLRRA